MRVEIAVLGPLEVRVDGRAVDLGTPKQRGVLSALLLAPGRPVSTDRITSLVWGGSAPSSPTSSVQAYLSRLRQALESDRLGGETGCLLTTGRAGYTLRVSPDAIDAQRLESLVTRAHAALRPTPTPPTTTISARDVQEWLTGLEQELASWRGVPFAELGDSPDVADERRRLMHLRLLALEAQAAGWVADGNHARAVVSLEELTAAHPLREDLWALRAVALARSGRQADGLAVLSELRAVLDRELGLELSPGLRALQTAILRQDPVLPWSPPMVEPPSRTLTRGRASATAIGPEGPASGDDWSTVGRDAEVAQLHVALARARRGRPTFVAITGGPGSGRSRLVTELVARAGTEGVRVAVGRCTQDESAPPLYPWRPVQTGLGLSGTDDAAPGASTTFATWQSIVGGLLDSSAQAPHLVVVEDVHWADPQTLRVLRLLVESADPGHRLLVVTTWRTAQVRPHGTIADLAANLARRQAVRIELTGLEPEAVGALWTHVAGSRLTDRERALLHSRTSGNPYLVTEHALLAARRGLPAAEVLRSVPTSVAELYERRLALLPSATRSILRTGAVVGDGFDLHQLARLTGRSQTELLEAVRPALRAGFVLELSYGSFAFCNPLVEETLRDQLPRIGAAQLRARLQETDRPRVAHA